jgi:hypothetical protein
MGQPRRASAKTCEQIATKIENKLRDEAIASLVDELGGVEASLAPHRASIAREDAIRKAIRGYYDGLPAEIPYEARGERFVVLVGHKAPERKVDPGKLSKLIGLKRFAQLAHVTLKALEGAIAAKDVDAGVLTAAVTAERTGTRSLKLFARTS